MSRYDGRSGKGLRGEESRNLLGVAFSSQGMVKILF